MDGSVRFKTSENQKPPVVELLEHLPVSSHEVIITGNVKSYDENPPTVRIFYGTEDHGFDLNAWEHNYSVNLGNTLSVGEFNATIPGLIQGETYFFRAFAESADGSDWSSGEPEVNEELIAFWRMDEVNGSLVSDSSDPFHDANLTSYSLSERPAGMSGNAIEFDGVNTLLDLDPANTSYLNEAFDARTFSAWLSLDPSLYTGPQVTRFNDLILYYPLDEESGINTTDLSIRQRFSRIEPLANWTSGKFDGGLSFDQNSTLLALASDHELEDLHKESFTVSLWIKPTHTSEGIFKEASIDAFQFQFPPSDYYLSSIENLLSRSPDLKSKIDGASVRISPRFIPDLVVWFDANDINNDDQPDLPESQDLSDWADKSGNGFDATGGSHQPFLRGGTGPNGGNFVEIRRGKYMNVNGNLFVKDIFAVLKSPSSTWSFYGGPLGHQNGRGSNYLTQHNQTNFHSNQLPSGVFKNGTALSGSFNLSPIDQFMVLRITVNDNSNGNHLNYQIGRCDGLQANLDIAEIVAFNSELSSENATLIEGILAHKWNLDGSLSDSHPYKNEATLNELSTKKRLSLLNRPEFMSAGFDMDNDSGTGSIQLFTGFFNAKESGTYSWQMNQISDEAALWFDINQNGIFEIGERLLRSSAENPDQNIQTDSIFLNAGSYHYAIYHGNLLNEPSLEVKFSSPSANSGASSLSVVDPSVIQQSDVFMTSTAQSLFRRGPLQLGIHGNGTPFYRHYLTNETVFIDGNNTAPDAEWSHLGLVVNLEESTLSLYLNGNQVGEEIIPINEPIDLLDYPNWLIGGNHPIEQDYFIGSLDDFRVYQSALSKSEIKEIYEGDINQSKLGGYRKQTIYDEGDADNGFSVYNVNGEIFSQVRENGTTVEVSSLKLREDQSIAFLPNEDPSMDLLLWLDASDLQSVESKWADKSGKENTATRFGQPSLIRSTNAGLSLMNYSGANGEYHGWSTINNARTIFWVVSKSGTDSNRFLLGDLSTYNFHASGKNYFHSRHASTAYNSVIRENGVFISNAETTPLPQNLSIISLKSESDLIASNFSNDRNIGGRTWKGDLGELLIFGTTLDGEDIKRIEGYLAHKWKLNENLEENHPFKSNAPGRISSSIDSDWHHWVASFGESPRTLELFMDGQPVGGPKTLQASGTIRGSSDEPRIGKISGGFVSDEFGPFKGKIDEVRIYNRGLNEFEAENIWLGDFSNSGSLEYRAIEEPKIKTLSAIDARPDSVVLRAEVLSLGGEEQNKTTTTQTKFDQYTFEGMQGWYSSLAIPLSNGQTITRWNDDSGKNRHFLFNQGNPRLLTFGLKGKPVVSFENNDLLWTGHDFEGLAQTGYTMIALARYSGQPSNRVISSANNDFYFGFDQASIGLWGANGEISNIGKPKDEEWHLQIGSIEKAGGDPAASFWLDGDLLTDGSRGSHNNDFTPGVLQLGGGNSQNQSSSCEITEVMIFSGELNELARRQIEGYLAHKWNLIEEILPPLILTSIHHPLVLIQPSQKLSV